MPNDSVTLGIDLGTTNCVVAWLDNGRPQVIGRKDHDGLVPSVLSFQRTPDNPEESGTWLAGWPALNNRAAAPTETVVCVKRLMGRWFQEDVVQETRQRFSYRIEDREGHPQVLVGDRELSPQQVSAEYLKLLRKRAEEKLKRTVDSAVITVPAYFEERQRTATREAAELAGLKVRKIIDEPTAAAIAYGVRGLTGRQTVLVFDLGGGTFDISLMHMVQSRRTGDPVLEVFEINGDSWLGGTDFDARITDYVIDEFEKKHKVNPSEDPSFHTLVQEEVERVRIALSRAERDHEQLGERGDPPEMDILIPNAFRTYGVYETLNPHIVNSLISDDVERTMECVTTALQNRNMSPDNVSRVLLVGGASQTPLVRRRLAEIFGPDRIDSDLDPMSCVAEGAAILAGRMRGVECPNPDCGYRQEIQDSRTGRTITRVNRTVNDEESEKCSDCGGPLVAGAVSYDGIQLREPTACSLGIMAVRGDVKDAYVCLIPKGTHYPLASPIRRSFRPFAKTTDELIVPVFEAADDEGRDRCCQGNVTYLLNETITDNAEIEVTFNLDRNRLVTVTVGLVGSDQEPAVQTLSISEPPANDSPAEQPWWETLETLMYHTEQMLRDYRQAFVEGELYTEEIMLAIEKARRILSEESRQRKASRKVIRIIGRLEFYLCESEYVTQLYLADLAIRGTGNADVKSELLATQKQLLDALESGNRADADQADVKLRTLMAPDSGAGDDTSVQTVDYLKFLKAEG